MAARNDSGTCVTRASVASKVPEHGGPDFDGLPYRPCVGLVVLDAAGRIFAGQRIDGMYEAWQMPQGGIDSGETPRQAAMRELTEETGITPDKVEVIRHVPPANRKS
jgi:putative (di)nucleoside polyphosphate hydrolase